MTQFNMMESPQGPDPKRLLLAVIATSSVLMLYSYFFAAPTTLPMAEKEIKEPIEKAIDSQPVEIVAHEAFTKDMDLVTRSFTSSAQGTDEIARTSYHVHITNLGGAIDRYALTDFREEHVLFDKEKLGSSLLRVSSSAPASVLKEDAPYEIKSSDESHIALRHVAKNGLEIERTYRFSPRALIEETITFKNLSSAPIKVAPVLTATKRDDSAEEASFFNPGVSGQGLAAKTDKYQKFAYGDLIDKPKLLQGIKYLAFDDQFFLAAIMPRYAHSIESAELVVQANADNKKIAHISFKIKPFILLHGEEQSITHQIFIGPKQVDLLASLSMPLDENIDFGWFGVLSRPMLWLLVQIFGFVKNYGLAIIIITFIIKLLTYPLTQKSFSSQQEMKKLQPKIKELQQKFGHDRTLLGQKQMELYRTHGINPVAGCLPLLIQLPIWFAFFQMLRNSVELFDQPFYWWITDLTRPDPYFVLPVLMGMSMLVQQAFTPPPTDQPHMKYVMWAMPIFLTFIMLNMPSGLSLYILTNNLLTIIQQIIIKKQSEKISVKI